MNEYNDRGERHGLWKFSCRTANFSNGILHGTFKNYWDNSYRDLLSIGEYYYGIPVGLWEYYGEYDGVVKLKEYIL